MSVVAVLIGPPGAGKTTVGRRVAARLQVPFVDTDQLVEQEAGASISDIFVEQGEQAFRALEAAAVARGLQGDGVLALGGGAAMHPGTAELLRGAPVVFLDVTIKDAAGRVGFDGSRPLLAVNPRATWTRMMDARRPTYEALATWRVDTGGRKIAEVVAQVSELIDPGSTERA
ncbi:shikimate kinase [Allobranchiibius sp. GilTou38]|uniref:shikimate kinase n=1 Tax=Allobranchiibius sp. GilTou38 TaxID=2815210 RepID=UPI001AA147B6|nr:shikimate kinase [Allobranchiibius sp. GilTou38]